MQLSADVFLKEACEHLREIQLSITLSTWIATSTAHHRISAQAKMLLADILEKKVFQDNLFEENRKPQASEQDLDRVVLSLADKAAGTGTQVIADALPMLMA